MDRHRRREKGGMLGKALPFFLDSIIERMYVSISPGLDIRIEEAAFGHWPQTVHSKCAKMIRHATAAILLKSCA